MLCGVGGIVSLAITMGLTFAGMFFFHVVASLLGLGAEALRRYWQLVSFAVLIATVAVAAAARGAELPEYAGPFGIPANGKEIALGHKLFFDPRLSADNSVSCSTCHDPRKGWADGRELAVGINGLVGTRHSPTVINAAYTPLVFWDGRTAGIEPQALLPLSNPIEMGRQSEAQVLAKLRLIPGYVSLFAEVYGIDVRSGSSITGPRLSRALSAFESTIISSDAPIDRRLDGDLSALTADEEVGFQLFAEANCMACHTPPLFTDNLFHNTGVEFASKFRMTDQGRADAPGVPNVRGTIRAFKTPSLREIGRTAPYMHAGSFADLDRVVLHYTVGAADHRGYVDAFLDEQIRPTNWTATQRRYVVKFLDRAFRGRSYPMISEPVLP